MKVKKVIIEGFHNVTRKEYDFQDVNYLHGKNGAGKSTVLQAIQLGLLGYVPGTNKTNKGVFTHSNNHTMAVRLVLDDDGTTVTIQRVWVKSKSSVNETLNVHPENYDIESLVSELELPLFNFDEFAHMTANKLKDWFINYLPKNTFTTDWRKELTAAVSTLPSGVVDESLIDEYVKTIESENSSGVEQIRWAHTYFKNNLSFTKKELERKESTIQSLVFYDDYSPVYSVEELKSQIESIRQNIMNFSIKEQTKSRIDLIRKELQSIEGSPQLLKTFTNKYPDAIELVESYSKELSDLETQYRELSIEYRSYNNIVQSDGVCVYTQKPCSDISTLKDTYIKRQEELTLKMKDLGDKINELRSKKSAAESNLKYIKDQISLLESDTRRYSQLESELSQYEVSSIEYDDDTSLESLQSKLKIFEDMYTKAVANQQYNELSEVILKDEYRLRNTIECLKQWVKLTDVNGLQASGDYNPFDLLSENINAVLKSLFGDSVSCKFNSSGAANSFSFGISRDNTYVPYNLLSSGEKCMFILSMYIGLLDYVNSPLRLILIDDFLDHLDDTNFKSIFEILHSNTDNQYIFAGVKSIPDVNTGKIIEI